MKAGAAYVPVDAAAPPWRAAFITHDCAVKVLVLEDVLDAFWEHPPAFGWSVHAKYTEAMTDMFAYGSVAGAALSTGSGY